MFKNLTYDNSLKDIVALTNPRIKNNVIVERGIYNVTALSPSEPCVILRNDTELVLKGDIYLTPNSFSNYSIIQIKGGNIILQGNGSIIGDKHTHLNNKGEWGMGIFIADGHNIKIRGVTIKDCWGDCIYITQGAAKVNIGSCILDHGRRQGISIISADDIAIRKCLISNVGGTAPEYAIDIEPNERDTVGSVIIDNVKVDNCRGGFFSYGKAKGASIKSITAKNSTINNTELTPIYFTGAKNIIIKNCSLQSKYEKKSLIVLSEIDSVWLEKLNINGSRINLKKDKHRINVDNKTRNIVFKR